MNEKLFVLIIEDSQEDAEFTVNHLRKAGYDISYQCVETAEGMKTAFENQKWDLILSDYSMPEFDVPSALAIYHESGADIPFIVVSGAIDEEKAVEMIKAGAHDYLLKDNMTRFVSVVERELLDGTCVHGLVARLGLQLGRENGPGLDGDAGGGNEVLLGFEQRGVALLGDVQGVGQGNGLRQDVGQNGRRVGVGGRDAASDEEDQNRVCEKTRGLVHDALDGRRGDGVRQAGSSAVDRRLRVPAEGPREKSETQ